MLELWKDVPKDYLENLQYRRELRGHARKDSRLRAAIRTACRDDILYWFNAWAWIEEPRPELDDDGIEKTTVLPFITWPHQEPVITATYEKLGFEDVGWEKTRGEGASWMACLFALHDWLFIKRAHIGLVSRNMDFADTADNMDSLFAKVDWSMTVLPTWMVGIEGEDWRRSTTKHTLRNLVNGSTIAAFAAVGDVASGGRKRWFLMDELAKFPKPQDQEAMASTQPVTKSRLIVSTYKGAYGAYYDVMATPSNMLKCVLDWRDNPTRNRGLYRLVNGKPIAVDPINNPLLPQYDPPTKEIFDMFTTLKRRGFNLESRTRSWWYDNECLRPGATPENIAEELDRDPSGSMAKYYSESFHEIVKGTVRLPTMRGAFLFRPESLDDCSSIGLKFEFDRCDDGEFYLWCSLDNNKRPPKGNYALACDVAAGGGGKYSSNSALEVVNLSTGEQVLEFASNTIEPGRFADLAMAVGYWFWTAFLSYEDNGPGGAFGRRVAERRYPDVYKRIPYWKESRNQIATPQPGWNTNSGNKQIMFSDLNMSVFEGTLIVRSQFLKEEFHQYIKDKDKIVHSHNPGGDATHGDRVIAMCVCNQAAKQRPQPKPGDENEIDPSNPPDNCMAGRMKAWEEQEAWERDEFREREPGELLGFSQSVPGRSRLDLY